MLLGDKHSSCCSCAKCECGKTLPATVTLDIQGRFGPKERSGDLVRTKVKSTFGCGAKIRVINPGGCESDKRPITREDIQIVSGGAGYAVLGRKQPDVSASVHLSTLDAELCDDTTIAISLSQGDDGGRPFWYVDEGSSLETECNVLGTYAKTTFEAGTVVVSRPRYLKCGEDGGYVVVNKGYFYLPDPTAVIVADIEVEVAAVGAGVADGVTITPVVDQDPESQTFGQIVDVEVGNGDALAWVWWFPCDCGDRTVVLPQSPADICLYRKCFCTDAPGPWLVNLTFEACHGTGATAHASEPIGIPGLDDGPITKITVDNGGSGYAVLGRVAPTVDGFRCDSGAEATITTTLASSTGQCDHPVWQVDAVTVTAGGYNYADGETVTFTTSDGTVETDGIGRITTTTAAPTLTIDSANGVDFSVSIASNGDTPQTWGVKSVTASDAGAGFVDNQQLAVRAGEHDTTFASADVRVRTRRSKPTVSATIISGSGSGGTATATLQKFSGVAGRDAWRVSSVTVRAGGAGYSVDDAVEFSLDGEQAFTVEQPAARVSTVSEEGEITAIDVSTPGQMFNDTGVLDEISVPSAGSYALAGIIESIVVIDGGRYYKTDPAQPALTSPITVTLQQTWPSEGTGATLEAIVDTVIDSPTFGQITDVTTSEAGDNYLAASTLTDNCYEVRYPGPPIDKIDDTQGSPTHGQKIRYQPPPSVRVIRGTCDYTRYGKDFVAKCDQFKFSVPPDDPCNTKSKMTITPGGTLQKYDPGNPCCGCCCAEGEAKSNPHVGESKCADQGGLFYKNASCEDVDCKSGPCCIPTIEGSMTFAVVEQLCYELGGTMLKVGQTGCMECECTINRDYDWTDCEGRSPFSYGFYIHQISPACGAGALWPVNAGGPDGVALDAPIVVNLFFDQGGGGVVAEGEDGEFNAIGSGGRINKYLVFVRSGTKVDWSTHCKPQFEAINGALKYVFTNCETGEVEIHDMTDFWSLHSAVKNSFEDPNNTSPCSQIPSDNEETGNAPCDITLVGAP